MKGLVPLVLGIFGTFGFSWLGLILIPNYQIGHLNPQMDEEATDVYPAPRSGMAERGRRVYIANGCIYCHSQQIRADYAASDIDRKWGERRSAPRDYIFDRPVLLGKERMGPDLANLGKRAPTEEEKPPAATNTAVASPAAAPPPAPAGGASPPAPAPSPAPTGGASPAAPAPSPAQSPAGAPAQLSPQSPPSQLPAPAASPAQSPAGPPAQSPATQAAPPPASPAQSPANAPPAPQASPNPATGEPPPYSAVWHHRHLYSPRSITLDSNMPAYRFLYDKRPIGSQPAADALKLTGSDAPREGWEIAPTYDAECLVAYLMSLDQSHPLKEVKSAAPAAAPAAAGSPAPAPPAQPPK